MPCTSPKLAFQHKFVKQPLRFTGREHYRLEDGTDPYKSEAYLYYSRHSDWKPLKLPCGDCKWCRIQNAREKGVRAFHEAQLHEHNTFITLTYNNKNLPADGSIDPEHPKAFVKRLRDRICRDSGCKSEWSCLLTRERRESCSGHCPKILTTGCAEYGEKLSRPHYHLIIFGFDFPDKKFWRWSKNDFSDQKWPVFRSDMLEELWTFGFSEIGSVTFESAAYVARYCVKKIKGDKKEAHYGSKLPERPVCVSNRKGIGRDWCEKFAKQLLSHDQVIVKGKKMSVPRYYYKKLEEWFPEDFLLAKERRLAKIKEVDLDGTKKRMKTRETVFEIQTSRLKRGFENV